MANLALIGAGVNIRSGNSTSLPIVTTTSAVSYASVYGVNRAPDADGYLWLGVQLTDGTQGYVRIDKVLGLIGDFSLLGASAYGGWTPAGSVFPSPVQPVANAPQTPQTSAAGAARWSSPVTPYVITEGYGGPGGHLGIDLAGVTGTPVYARGRGIVWQANKCAGCASGNGPVAGTNDPRTNYGYGNEVILRFASADLPAATQAYLASQGATGGCVFLIHGHLNDLSVGAGAAVVDGTLIGHRGNSGNSTGSHLHIETRWHSSSNPASLWDNIAKVFDPAQLFAI